MTAMTLARAQAEHGEAWRDVLQWRASEVADLSGISATAVNRLLPRVRARIEDAVGRVYGIGGLITVWDQGRTTRAIEGSSIKRAPLVPVRAPSPPPAAVLACSRVAAEIIDS